jgi:hypothetical protein
MRWCPKGESSGSFKDGPTLCFIQTIFCELINLFFILLLFYRISQLVNRVTFEFIEDQTRILLRVFQFLCLAELVFASALGISQTDSLATAFFVLCEALSWFLVFVVVTLEVWKSQKWPWIIIKIYLGFSCFSYILLCSIILHNGSSKYEVAFSLTQLGLDIIIFLIAIFKDLVRSSDDIAKEELKRYSAEFLSSSPMGNENEQDHSSSMFSKVWQFFKSREPEETISFRNNRSSFDFWFGNHNKQELEEFPPGMGNPNGRYEDSFRSSLSSHRNVSMVESAIDRNSLGGSSANRKKENQSILSSMFRWNSNERYSNLRDEDLDKFAPLISSEQEEKLFLKEELPSYVPSKAINKVMEQHRAKISASNPILEPRGNDQSSNIFTPAYSSSEPNKSMQNSFNYKEANTPSTNRGGNYSETENLRYNVTIQRWGIRKTLKEGDIEKVRSSDNLSYMSNSPHHETDSREKADIEFEIIVNAQTVNNSGANNDLIMDKDFSDQQQSQSHSTRWTVWRTAGEISKLHAMVLSLFGDLTPRPPRLTSANSSTNATHAELISDMRAITIFLNALLRMKNGPSLKPIYEFMDLEKAKGLTSNNNSNDASSLIDLVDKNEYRDNSNLRDSEQQQEVMSEFSGKYTTTEGGSTGGVGTNSPKSSKRSNNPQSLMDVADQDAANNPNNQHEKWRKIFYQMKIKLKPHDIAVRCRLFEGVISGGEIAGWLIRSTSASPEVNVEQQANNRAEACAIGQELVICGLILPVSSGFIEEDPHEHDLDNYEAATTDRSSVMQMKGQPSKSVSTNSSNEEYSKFSDMPGYIYRFPLKSGTAGSWSLFGATIVTKIPMMTVADENENMKSTRDTVILMVDNGLATETGGGAEEGVTPPPNASAGGHVKYLIDIAHGEDKWQTVKR